VGLSKHSPYGGAACIPDQHQGNIFFGTADQFDQVLIRRINVGCGTGGFTTATTAEMAALQLSQTTVSA
jgi:hypothetical protein